MEQKRRLDKIVSDFIATKTFTEKFTPADARYLCAHVTQILRNEPTLLRIDAPVNVCGDVHGQFSDLVKALLRGGLPPFTRWLFLGDYVDRGPKSVEVICFLFALKMKYPNHILLIRGNHESPEMNACFGFQKECEKKLGAAIFQEFCRTFEYLPLAAVVGGKYFCVHGGIGPDLKSLSQIEELTRPLVIPADGFITDLLWSDPCSSVDKYGPNARGPTVTWGRAPVQEFMKRNNLTKVIRGHQVARDGFEFPFSPDESVVTMFTASNYSLEMHNRAAFLSINARMECDYQVLPESPAEQVTRPRAQSTLEKRPTIPLKATTGTAHGADMRKSSPTVNVGVPNVPMTLKVKAMARTRPRTNSTAVRPNIRLSRGVSS